MAYPLPIRYGNKKYEVTMPEKITELKKISEGISRTRMLTGGIIFIAGQLAPLTLPLILSSGLSAGLKTTLTGLMMLGIPELAILLAVIILGKSGFNYLKQKIFALFRRLAPPDTVTRPRYHLGLLLFSIPILTGWLLPYFTDLIPFYEQKKLWISLTGDGMILISLFILGGEFWDKLRGLFIYDTMISRVNRPEKDDIPSSDLNR